jgi:LmbE family N-acetylglucosaminyl deacetylase
VITVTVHAPTAVSSAPTWVGPHGSAPGSSSPRLESMSIDARSTDRSTDDRVEALGTILSIWAHPDDETYLAGGVMAEARDHGQRVVCVSATAGEHGTPDPATWPPERLGPIRRWEAAAAMAILGVAEHHILGLPDGSLAEHDDAGRRWVRGLLEEVAPDTILTFGADGMTFHPDHIAVHRWVTEAWEERGRRSRLLYATTSSEHLAEHRERYEQWGIYMTDDRPLGTPCEALAIHLRLEGRLLDRKLTALSAMASQTGGLSAALGAELYAEIVADEWFVEASSRSSARR